MKPLNIVFINFLLLTSISCSYSLKQFQDQEGNKYWGRVYKNNDDFERYKDRNVFKNQYTRKNHSKYSNKIVTDTVNEVIFVQFDSIRVYLFNDAKKYSDIFSEGLLSGQMIYCELDSNCTPTKDITLRNAKTGKILEQNIWGWKGHTIRIEHFEELFFPKQKCTVKRFKFWVYPYKNRFNGGNNIFLLELTNTNANKETNLSDFILNSKVTFLKHSRIMI